MSVIPKRDRIIIIDVLRGFALFGIILVHMVEQYYAGPMPDAVAKANTGSIADNIFLGFVSIFITGKFYMIFSFLFGLSFFIQSSTKESDKNFLIRFAWRLLLLFGIGTLHHIHYRGDILGIYAILGFGLLLFFKASDKVLLTTGLLLVLNIPSVIIRIAQGLISETGAVFPEQNQAELTVYYETLKNGAYLDILKQNFFEFAAKMEIQFLSGRIFITLGLFLLGYYSGRKEVFSNLAGWLPQVKKFVGYSWKILLGVVAFSAIFFGGMFALKLQVPQFVQFSIGGLAYDVFNACLATIYLGGVILLFQRERWRARFMNFYALGRMGLTTYLMQTVVGFLIFFSPGLGLLNELGAAICFGLAIVLFVAQILFSNLWLRHFNYGLFEWLWRSLTYFKGPPMLKNKSSVLAPAN